jgi:hypothetical protein
MTVDSDIQRWIDDSDSLAEFIEIAESNDVLENLQAKHLAVLNARQQPNKIVDILFFEGRGSTSANFDTQLMQKRSVS